MRGVPPGAQSQVEENNLDDHGPSPASSAIEESDMAGDKGGASGSAGSGVAGATGYDGEVETSSTDPLAGAAGGGVGCNREPLPHGC